MMNFFKNIFQKKESNNDLEDPTSLIDNSKIIVSCSIKEKIVQEGSFSKIEIVKEKDGSVEVHILGTSEIDGTLIASSFIIHPKDEEHILNIERNSQGF